MPALPPNIEDANSGVAPYTFVVVFVLEKFKKLDNNPFRALFNESDADIPPVGSGIMQIFIYFLSNTIVRQS